MPRKTAANLPPTTAPYRPLREWTTVVEGTPNLAAVNLILDALDNFRIAGAATRPQAIGVVAPKEEPTEGEE